MCVSVSHSKKNILPFQWLVCYDVLQIIFEEFKQWPSWLKWWLIFCLIVILFYIKCLVSSPVAKQSLAEYKDLIVSLKCLASPWIRDSYFLTLDIILPQRMQWFLEPIYTQIKWVSGARSLLLTSHHWPCKVVPSSWPKPVWCMVIVLASFVVPGAATSLLTDPPAITAFFSFSCCVLSQPGHFHTACRPDRGMIFSRMLVSHGGLDVFYPVSSTIWNQCSWSSIAAAEKQRNHKGSTRKIFFILLIISPNSLVATGGHYVFFLKKAL